jgi:hypothetical protein
LDAVLQKVSMQLRQAVKYSHEAGLLSAPALELPALEFELPQLCWPLGHVGPQLALPKARLKPKLNNPAAKICLYTAGR